MTSGVQHKTGAKTLSKFLQVFKGSLN